MSSCIPILYLVAVVALPGAAAADPVHMLRAYDGRVQPAATMQQAAAGDPDALYADRETLASATAAAEIWAARLAADSHDFAAAWKLARARYWLGTAGLPQAERKAALESGITAGRAAVAAAPDRPEGHFWIAANMGALAESFGLRQGLKYRGNIRDELETTLKLDPAFLEGSADRALGRWYYKVPGLFGGDKKKSEAHLRKALTYNPDSIITHLFLAETLIALDRDGDAKQELEAAIAAPLDPEWTPEDRRFKAQAKELLAKIGDGGSENGGSKDPPLRLLL